MVFVQRVAALPSTAKLVLSKKKGKPEQKQVAPLA
jgi:hypothetical protein